MEDTNWAADEKPASHFGARTAVRSERSSNCDSEMRSDWRGMGAQEDGVVEDTNWAADAEGTPGEEVALHLLMRVVADVGIVGLPNAGKSSLLAALTR